MMARSKLVLAVLGAAAALAAAGCGSVTAGASHSSAAGGHSSAAGGHASAAGGHSSATASPGGSSAASSAPARGQPNAVGGPIQGGSQLLCSAPGSASQVVITRTGTSGPLTPGGPVVAAYRTGTPAPAGVVKGAAQASELARAVCALPAMTGGVVHCPQLDGVSYRLAFSAGGRLLPAVVVQPSGCQTVTGAGVVRTAASRPAFLKLLVSMVGIVRVPGVAHQPGVSAAGPAIGGA